MRRSSGPSGERPRVRKATARSHVASVVRVRHRAARRDWQQSPSSASPRAKMAVGRDGAKCRSQKNPPLQRSVPARQLPANSSALAASRRNRHRIVCKRCGRSGEPSTAIGLPKKPHHVTALLHPTSCRRPHFYRIPNVSNELPDHIIDSWVSVVVLRIGSRLTAAARASSPGSFAAVSTKPGAKPRRQPERCRAG